MGVAYSQDLRDRVMAAVDGGLSVYSAAPLFRVSVSYIYKALGRRRATGDVTAHKSGGGLLSGDPDCLELRNRAGDGVQQRDSAELHGLLSF
jgi:Transposase